jgi:hypothetical protein
MLSLALFSGCASEKIDSPDAGVAPGDPSQLVGSFRVRLIAPADPTPGYTAIFGKVYDGPTPMQLIWEEAFEEGRCELLEPRVPFCNTPCSGGAICVEDDVCQAYPAAHGAGTITVRGVRTAGGANEIAISPVANNYQSPSLPYPAFDEGAALSLAAAGDYFEPFTIDARGIAPLVSTSTALVLDRDRQFALAWTPAGIAEVSAIHVKIDISHHGGTKGMIECDAGDDGALSIPVAMTNALLDLGVAGFPSVIVTRRAEGSAVIAQGRVELVVSSEIETIIDIPGVVSCTSDQECPSGACQADLTCR